MKMENELKELKSVLRSLVVSSPTEVDLRTLLRDYRNMMGEPIPLSRYGYRDGLTFIKERCSDCFVIRDSSCNPVLTLIVPDSVKHIDNFVQRQKSSSITRFKGKRRSVPESAFKECDLVVKTFKPTSKNLQKTEYTVVEENKEILHKDHRTRDSSSQETMNRVCGSKEESREPTMTNGVCSSNALKNFMKKRMPMFSSSQYLDTESLDKDSSKADTDSGRQTSSSKSSSKRAQLEELKMEIRDVIADVPEGVWCTELMRLYREKYGRELNFSRFGFTGVLSLAYAVEGLHCSAAQHTGDVLLLLRPVVAEGGVEPSAGERRPRPPRAAPAPPRDHPIGDPEDALPGIDFDEDVFPRDSMHIMQSIPSQPLDALVPGAMLEVVLGEVYSPTHFWMLRLGPEHYSAMEEIMDEMNNYYRGEGRERVLAGGALRVGHYCACCYQGDWHRAVIVKILDSDTVKVRHVDYATVEAVAACSLKPLLRRWAALPAQALRARLAGARPPAAGRRWPWAAAAHFLQLIRERQLVALVVAKDAQEGILEVLLIDTSTKDDICISTEMCRSGHADPRPDSALGTSECYLYPRFDALETGDTPNYAEIYCYLRDGISLEFVEDYRRHVPSCLPPPAGSPGFSHRPVPALVPSPSPTPTPSPPPWSILREPSPLPRSCESSPRPSTLREPSPPPLAPSVTPATRSLCQLAERPAHTRVERAASLSPSLEAPSLSNPTAVANRIPLLRPEPSAGPAQCAWPASAYPQAAPFHSSHHSMHLSPFAPPFYPQAPHAYAPPPSSPHLVPGPLPAYFPGPRPVFVPQPVQFCLGAGPAQRRVSVPASECEIFALLGRVDPAAAHRYMVDALNRAFVNTCVSLPAPRVCAETQTEIALRPPPGFERTAAQPPPPPQPAPDP